MQSDENIPKNGADAPNTPPPVIDTPAQLPANQGPARKLIAFVLNLGLALFVADSLASLADDTLVTFFNNNALSVMRGVVFFCTVPAMVVIYLLMAVTPMIPKRWFLPVTLFNLVVALLLIPFSIYSFDHLPQIAWATSLAQFLFAVGILCWIGGGFTLRWPLIATSQLGPRGFSWQNLLIFTGANVLLLPPAVAIYLIACAGMAVSHYTEGFMALRPGGLSVQVRKYVRNDGHTIQLYPMSHVADADFYRKISESFPTNAVILMEGVTDRKNLLTNKISYKRMAATLGLAEQHEKFVPSQGETVRADIDVDQFRSNTIGLLNLAMFVHSKGINPETILAMLQYPQPPDFQVELFDDLIHKRNAHLLEEIRAHLSESRDIVVPWGALHMPGIAREIQEEGFHLEDTHNYFVIRFGPREKTGQ